MNKNKTTLISLRDKALVAKTGELIKCPSCNTMHLKTNYQTVFCKTKGKTKCKDNYWNNVDPSKRNNTTRISPANAFYKQFVILPRIAEERGFPDVETMRNHVDDFDGSWDAHGAATVLPCEWCGLRHEYCQCD